MPVGEQADRRVTWNHFSFHVIELPNGTDFRGDSLARRRLEFIASAGAARGLAASCRIHERRPYPRHATGRLLGVLRLSETLLFRFRRFFPTDRAWLPFSPRIAFLARAETGEIAAARRAAVGSRADTQHDARPGRRMVVMLAPGGQLLPVAARAARVFPGPRSPRAGFPTGLAAPAAQRINPHQPFDIFRKILPLRYTHIPGTAFRTRQLHLRPLTRFPIISEMNVTENAILRLR